MKTFSTTVITEADVNVNGEVLTRKTRENFTVCGDSEKSLNSIFKSNDGKTTLKYEAVELFNFTFDIEAVSKALLTLIPKEYTDDDKAAIICESLSGLDKVNALPRFTKAYYEALKHNARVQGDAQEIGVKYYHLTDKDIQSFIAKAQASKKQK